MHRICSEAVRPLTRDPQLEAGTVGTRRTALGAASVIVTSAFVAGCVALFILRSAAICYLPIHDFDTGSLVSILHGGFRSWRTLTDIAHPGALAALMGALGLLSEGTGHAATLWSGVSTIALASSTALLFFLARGVSGSLRVAAAAALAYLASPILADLTGRGEENLLFHGLFVLGIRCLHWFSQRASRPLAAMIAIVGVLLAGLHVQPFVVLAVGPAACAFLRGEDDHAVRRIRMGAAIFAGSGLAYLLVVGVFVGLATPNYLQLYFSVFHNDSLQRYLRAFLLFAQGYMLTGHMSYHWTAPWAGGAEPASSIYWLGVPALAMLAATVHRARLVDCITLSALALVFVYEPSSSERWDTLLIAALLSLSGMLGDRSRWKRRYAAVGMAILLVANGAALGAGVAPVLAAYHQRAQFRSALGASTEVLVGASGVVSLATMAPAGIKLHNLDQRQDVLPGTAVYLRGGDRAEGSTKCGSSLKALALPGLHRCE